MRVVGELPMLPCVSGNFRSAFSAFEFVRIREIRVSSLRLCVSALKQTGITAAGGNRSEKVPFLV